MPAKLDHIGIFVEDLDAAIAFYRIVLDHGAPAIVDIPELGLRLAFFAGHGGAPVELVTATGRTELRHGDVVVALEVENVADEIARLAGAGIKCHHQKPTANLPFERGWVTKGNGLGTIIELCPKGEIARFVAAARA